MSHSTWCCVVPRWCSIKTISFASMIVGDGTVDRSMDGTPTDYEDAKLIDCRHNSAFHSILTLAFTLLKLATLDFSLIFRFFFELSSFHDVNVHELWRTGGN